MPMGKLTWGLAYFDRESSIGDCVHARSERSGETCVCAGSSK